MARVYLAESVASGLLRKLVVLKVLNQELASDPDMRSAFVREAEISARLNHPNIVNVHEVFEQGGTPVMVMQHLDGMALSDILSKLSGKIPLKLHLNIMCQVLDALHYFHELKSANGESLECVHRDISPHNVMVLHEGGIKVVDFGVAKVREQAESDNHTRTGIIKGKIAYMPPEQLLASTHVDRRADIYSVGVMLWEAVAGRRMWRGYDASARMRAIVRGEIPDIKEAAPGVSDQLVQIINRALAHSPDARFATAEEMQIELEQVTLTEGGHSLPRELAEFMRNNFGDERREKQRAIEKAVDDPEYSLAGTSWSTAGSRPSASTERSGVQMSHPDSLDPSVVIVTNERRHKPLITAGLVAALAIAVAAVLWSQRSEPQVASITPASSAPAPIMLRIDSQPAGAEVYVDDVRLGVTPLSTQRAASAQPATVELRAPGHVAERKVVSLQTDLSLNLALSREAQPVQQTKPASAEPVQADQEEHKQGAARARRPFARAAEGAREKGAEVAPAQAPAAAKPNAPADGCDPPYRLDPGGVKVFKPQCF